MKVSLFHIHVLNCSGCILTHTFLSLYLKTSGKLHWRPQWQREARCFRGLEPHRSEASTARGARTSGKERLSCRSVERESRSARLRGHSQNPHSGVRGTLARASQTTCAPVSSHTHLSRSFPQSIHTAHGCVSVPVCPRVVCEHAYVWVYPCAHASCQREHGPSLIAGWEMGSLPAKQLGDLNQVHGKSMSLSASISFKSP